MKMFMARDFWATNILVIGFCRGGKTLAFSRAAESLGEKCWLRIADRILVDLAVAIVVTGVAGHLFGFEGTSGLDVVWLDELTTLFVAHLT